MLSVIVTALLAVSTLALVVLVYNTVKTGRRGNGDPTETAKH